MNNAPSTSAVSIRGMIARADWQSARDRAAQWVAAEPDAAEGHFLLGLADAETGRIRSAIASIETAALLDGRGEYLAQLARLYVLVRQDEDAAAALRRAEQALPEDALSLDTIGCVYARLGDHPASLPHFAEAVRLAPGNVAFLYNHAAALSFVGRTADAEGTLAKLLALSPGNGRAYHLLSGLRRQTAAANHVAPLRAALRTAADPVDRLQLGYALAKELEDLDDHSGAFETLRQVNDDHRRALSYDFSRDAEIFDAVERTAARRTAAPGRESAPIFIIGMPRTGTTLVDRILSSHPDVESAGELQAMPLAVKAVSGTPSRTVLDAATLSAAALADHADIGRLYMEKAKAHRRQPDKRFVDKFPGNFLYVSFIAQALPDAPIICLRRNPMDTVFANFRNLFAISSRYYDYSYSLLDIAAYYRRFDRLMRLWRDLFPGRILEVQYEKLVDDQESETRRLLEHCELPWSDACLSFHANSAAVSTPSAAQVRRPIYRDSMGKWRRHAAALEPVRRFFEQQGIAVE
ncbi:sulfotransferase [Sphingomonas sp. Root710]|uniref:tetratricopeptide repeat-containing sulfotransferase family protein n=1 Tax=Sphingomonas sp. Root710 TaxID=1736594 RepID=UPI0039E17BD3